MDTPVSYTQLVHILAYAFVGFRRKYVFYVRMGMEDAFEYAQLVKLIPSIFTTTFA